MKSTSPFGGGDFDLEPGFIPATIDEVLRYASPVHTFCRTSTQAVQLFTVIMPADSKILCVMGAANRDPARWENPETFDITRPSRPHVAFGSGIHVCVGQHLARQEISAMLSALVARVERLELTGSPQWQAGNAVRSLTHLPLRLHAV